MATATESPQRSILATTDGHCEPMGARIVPIPTPTIQMSAPSPGEPMEITTPTNASSSAAAAANSVGSPMTGTGSKSPEAETNGASPKNSSPTEGSVAGGGSMAMAAPPAAAAAAVHQPKIVQTAFIHKLYNMLEDPAIQHLIAWSGTADSFVMSPSADFSKVLAQYFKHTNISSFVRQLNMYGFHKVSDVFHTGNPDTALWEFKHGNGNFKRGDLVGLREIKRRASRHALVHREYPNQKPSPSQPGTPAEPMPMPPESGDARVDHALYDFEMRLRRSEEGAHYTLVKQQALMETMARLLHFNQEISRAVLSLAPSPDNPIHRDVVALQSDIQRQAEMLRAMDEPPEPPFSSTRQYFANVDNAPVSPRQLPQDDPRRNNLTVPGQARGQANYYRPPVPSNLSISTRRPYGSIGASTTQPSPSSLRPGIPPPPPAAPHPLAAVEPPPGSLARRHTSADIRAHGWQPNPSPFATGGPGGGPPSSTPWPPPSPNRIAPEDQRIRESLSSYSLQAATQHQHHASRPVTPPPYLNGSGPGIGGTSTSTASTTTDSFGSWSWNSAGRGGDNKSLSVKDSSAPPTRRGSMAHILNPTDTAEQENEDEDPRGEEDRKRKRMQ